MVAIRKNNTEKLMIFLNCETHMKPEFTKGKFQIVKEFGFMQVEDGLGTHLVQGIKSDDGTYLPIGWTKVRKSLGLFYYKKLPVEIEKVEPNQKVDLLTIDNKNDSYNYNTSKGGYILSNSLEDKYFVDIDKFNELYTVLNHDEHFQIGEYILQYKLYDLEGSLEEVYEVSYDGEIQGQISCRPIYEITEQYLNNFFFN